MIYEKTNLSPLYGPSNPPFQFAGEIQKGTLPADIDAAYRGAFWAARSTNTILDHCRPSVAPYCDAPVPLIFLFDEWQRPIDYAVRQVADEIALARGKRKPIQFGNLTAATHHEIALQHAEFVFATVYRALCKAAKLPSVRTVEIPPYRELFEKHWQNIAAALADTRPLGIEFQAALKLEALRTLEYRRQAQQTLDAAKPIAAEPLAEGAKKKPKRRGGRRRLELSHPQKARVYEIIRKEHRPGEPRADLVDRLKQNKDFMVLAQEAGVGRINSKLVRKAIEHEKQRSRDARKKQETDPA